MNQIVSIVLFFKVGEAEKPGRTIARRSLYLPVGIFNTCLVIVLRTLERGWSDRALLAEPVRQMKNGLRTFGSLGVLASQNSFCR